MLKFIGFLITIWAVLVTINANTVSKYTRHESDYFFKRVKDQYLDTLTIDATIEEQNVKHLFVIDLSPSILKLDKSLRSSLNDSLSHFLKENGIIGSENNGPENLVKLVNTEKDLILLALNESIRLKSSVKFLLFKGHSEQLLVLNKFDVSPKDSLKKNWQSLIEATSINNSKAKSHFGEIYTNLAEEITKEQRGFDKVIISVLSDFIPEDGIPKTQAALKKLQKELSAIENEGEKNKFQFNFLFFKGYYKTNNEKWQKQASIHKQLLNNDLQTTAFTHEFDLTEITNIDILKRVNWSPIKYDPVLSNIILFGPRSQFRKEYYQNSDLKFSKLSFSKGGRYSFQIPGQFSDTLMLTHNDSIYTLTKQQRTIILDVKDEKDIVEISSRNEFTEFSKLFIANAETGYREAFVLDQSKRLSSLQTKLLLVIPYYFSSLIIFLIIYLFYCFIIYLIVQKNNIDLASSSPLFFIPILRAALCTFLFVEWLSSRQMCDSTLGFICGNNQLYIYRDFSLLFTFTIVFIFLIEIYQYLKNNKHQDIPDDGGDEPPPYATSGTHWK